jgi:hypothetical protein
MISDQDRDRIHDFLDGRLAPAQADAFQRRIANDVELAAEVAEMKRLLTQLTSLRAERAPEGFAGAVIEKLRAPRGGVAQLPRWLVVVVPAAAAVIFAAVFLREQLVSETLVARDIAPTATIEKPDQPPAPSESDKGLARDDLEVVSVEAGEELKLADQRADRETIDAATNVAPEDDRVAFKRASEPTAVDAADAAKPGAARDQDDTAGSTPKAEESAAAGGDGSRAVTFESDATAPPVTHVWRVKRAARNYAKAAAEEVSSGIAARRRGDDEGSWAAPSVAPSAAVLRAVEAIRAASPERVVERELDEAAREVFLAEAARAGFVVLQYEGEIESRTELDADREPPTVATLSARGVWSEIAGAASADADRPADRVAGGGGGAVSKPHPAPATAGKKSDSTTAGPASPATPGSTPPPGSPAAEQTEKKAKTSQRGEPAGPTKKVAPSRILIVYEDEPPPK